MLRKLLWSSLSAAPAATSGGIKAKLAEPFFDDTAFLRKLKPSLIKARAKGEAPPGEPQLGAWPKPPGGRSGPNPFVVAGAALVVGVALAKWIDWRGRARPRV
jgi:hypothetical protein